MTSISSTTSTTMPMVTMSPTIAHPSGKNPQNNPQTPLMGLGVGYPQGIGGSSYISANATAISPFKHSIVSQNPNFRYNEFVTNYEKSKNKNRQNSKTMKMEAIVAAHDAEPTTNRLFPTYDPNKDMMDFMVFMPPARDNNPPKSQLDPSEFQVSTLQVDLSKI